MWVNYSLSPNFPKRVRFRIDGGLSHADIGPQDGNRRYFTILPQATFKSFFLSLSHTLTHSHALSGWLNLKQMINKEMGSCFKMGV